MAVNNAVMAVKIPVENFGDNSVDEGGVKRNGSGP